MGNGASANQSVSKSDDLTVYSQASSNPLDLDHMADTLLLKEHLADQPQLAKNYYAQVPFEDIANRSPPELTAAALSHWNFSTVRRAGESLLRLYNPTLAEHGWTSERTIIEIVTRDRPFLVRSISQAIAAHGLTVQQFIHPVFNVTRGDDGRLGGDTSANSTKQQDNTEDKAESFMQIHVEYCEQPETLNALTQNIIEKISDIRRICDDWETMKQASSEAAKRLRDNADQQFDTAETCDFIDWLQQYHFTFFGYCEIARNDKGHIEVIDNIAHGIFSGQQAIETLKNYMPLAQLIDENNELFSYTKSTDKAPLLRTSPMDIVCFQRIDENGNRAGKCIIAGFFTSRVTSTALETIPVLRHKALQIVARSGINPGAHDGKVLLNTLETFPRDTLLLADESTIYPIARGIMDLYHQPRVRLFGVQDRFEQFSTCFVYVPSDIYSRELRLRIQSILQQNLQADSVEFEASFSSDNSLARMHFYLRTSNEQATRADFSTLEQQVVEAAQRWDDSLRDALQAHGSTALSGRSQDWLRCVPEAYKQKHGINTATRDLLTIAETLDCDVPQVLLHQRKAPQMPGQSAQQAPKLQLNIYHRSNQLVPLSKVIHILEHMGFSVDGETPYEFAIDDEKPHKLREFILDTNNAKWEYSEAIATQFQQAFSRIWPGEMEDDGLNQLIVAAGLSWRQINIIRCYAKYLLQIKLPFSQEYITTCLVENPQLAQTAAALFEHKFNPLIEARDIEPLQSQYANLLEQVKSLDHDRILRTLGDALNATLRTNHYVKDEHGNHRDSLSIKISPNLINGIPLPCPLFEIFVCSPRVEAVHLRGGKVARGGLRWSDRREDFRTEVLGLMKAQMVKNSVIVPVGSKGGFVVKRLPAAGATREELMQEVVYCYQTFLRSMLDITDNYIAGQLIAPTNVVRHDEDDPYLVVAADKGTATFSDIANGVSAEYNFWLGDAFASGGSVGYDHKGMGITAKGAWESVKRHFRELGTDTQRDEFTVIGIGDMAGDVFGNGMLLSPQIRLLGAFNHLHIFLDPNPDAASSFAERKRLFELPRSSWEDYDKRLISAGGGIFSRSQKSIPLSTEVQKMLCIETDSMTPLALMNAMLKARVDLLWNGGIGTYIKASVETNADAQDKANDALRVSANELQARVVGEGGNLGATQRGRIEFSAQGGKIYTDAIDNSAGVDCSDHEVNIKILVDALVSSGALETQRRAGLLADMTDDVSQLVLRDNYQQTQCISLALAQAPLLLEEHARFIAALEASGKLNREIEYLPDAEAIAERAATGQGLTAPELSVLVAYSKMDLYEQLLESAVLDDRHFDRELAEYFPHKLQIEFAEQLQQHQLRREIIATLLTNSLVNRLGPTYIFRLQEEIGAESSAIAAAYAAIRKLYSMRSLWSDIEALDNVVESATQRDLLLIIRGWVERGVHWMVNNRRGQLGIDQNIEFFKHSLTELRNCIPSALPDSNRTSYQSRSRHFETAGVPQALANRVSAVVPLSSALDIIEIAATQGMDINLAVSVYYHLGSFLQLQWLRDQIAALETSNHWHALAISALRTDLHYQHRHLTAEVLDKSREPGTAAELVEQWASALPAGLGTFSQRVNEIKSTGTADYAMLSLAVAEVHKLLQTARPLAGTD